MKQPDWTTLWVGVIMFLLFGVIVLGVVLIAGGTFLGLSFIPNQPDGRRVLWMVAQRTIICLSPLVLLLIGALWFVTRRE